MGNPKKTGKLPEITDAGALTNALVEHGESADVLPVHHYFSEGLYTRTMYIPADTFVVGKLHRHKTLNILLKGELVVYTQENEQPRRLKAPLVFETEPLVRKIVYTLTPVQFANVHVTAETDLEKIEKEFIVPEDQIPDLSAELKGFAFHLSKEQVLKITQCHGAQ